MQRQAQAVWRGDLQQGRGEISTMSGALKNVPYSFNTRFGESPGTNPEELIAAAHSSCFAMAASAGLSAMGFPPEDLHVVATVMLDKTGESWNVRSSHLKLRARIAGITRGQFMEIAEDAKKNCPISRLLSAEITLDAQLDESAAHPWSPPPAH